MISVTFGASTTFQKHQLSACPRRWVSPQHMEKTCVRTRCILVLIRIFLSLHILHTVFAHLIQVSMYSYHENVYSFRILNLSHKIRRHGQLSFISLVLLINHIYRYGRYVHKFRLHKSNRAQINSKEGTWKYPETKQRSSEEQTVQKERSKPLTNHCRCQVKFPRNTKGKFNYIQISNIRTKTRAGSDYKNFSAENS